MALSARLDGEAPGVEGAALDDHLAGCAGCRAWEVDARQLTRSVRLSPAPAIPDQTAAILVAAGRAATGRAGATSRQLRAGLAVIGLLQLVLAVAAALVSGDSGSSLHVAHELAAFEAALAAGFLFAAARPERAWGMVPMAAAAVGCLITATAIDVVRVGATSGEAVHALELVGLGLLWLLARWHRPAPTAPIRALTTAR